MRIMLSQIVRRVQATAASHSSKTLRSFASLPLAANAKAQTSAGRARASVSAMKVKFGAQRTQLEEQIDALTTKASDPSFQTDVEYLRHASRLLHQCKSRDQMLAALPLCTIVDQPPLLHGSAAMECVRIYQRLGRHQHVVDLVQKLFDHKYFLMNPVLVHAIQSCAALQQVATGFQLFERAVERGTIANMAVYNALLTLAASVGDFVRIDQVLEQIKADGFALNQASYHTIIHAYIKKRDVNKALALAEQMKADGIAQDGDTAAILMNAYAEQNDFDGAWALMEKLKASQDMKPKLIHYNTMIKACGRASKLPMAFQLYEEMKKQQIQPDSITYITMMHAVYHGELGHVDTTMVKAALAGFGCIGLACVPMIDLEEHLMTALFCGSMVGSMGLAMYMNPDGVQRALYPNIDEPRTYSIIEAFFRRLREEDHCGRSMYLWREMLKFGIPVDPRVYDVLVRTCIKKRHPELAYEALFEQKLPLTDSNGAFVLSMTSTVQFLHALLVQRRMKMADELFDAALQCGLFKQAFHEGPTHRYDLRAFGSLHVRAYVISKVLARFQQQTVPLPRGKGGVEFLVLHGYELLDQLDATHPHVRELFSMDAMIKEKARSGQYYFKLPIDPKRLEQFATTPPVETTMF